MNFAFLGQSHHDIQESLVPLMIIVISLVLSAVLLVVAMATRRKRADGGLSNVELEIYYGMLAEPVSKQLRQLVLAAKLMMKRADQLSRDSETISGLYDDRVISDEYFRRYKDAEEDLLVEKTIIENEADSLRSGSKDAVFVEAKKFLASESSAEPVQKIFGEALFLKKRDSLSKDLRSRKTVSLQ